MQRFFLTCPWSVYHLAHSLYNHISLWNSGIVVPWSLSSHSACSLNHLFPWSYSRLKTCTPSPVSRILVYNHYLLFFQLTPSSVPTAKCFDPNGIYYPFNPTTFLLRPAPELCPYFSPRAVYMQWFITALMTFLNTLKVLVPSYCSILLFHTCFILFFRQNLKISNYSLHRLGSVAE